RDSDHRKRQKHGVPDSDPDALVGEDRTVVFQPGEAEATGLERVPREEAVVDRQHERDLRHQEHVDESGQQGPTPRPWLTGESGGGGYPRASTLVGGTDQCCYVWYFLPTAAASVCALASA